MDYKQIGDVRYHQKGKYPQLVFCSGTHGNEFHVIDPLTRILDEMYTELPDFLFIPEVSPSAVALQTRLNKYSNNINRNFGHLTDPEAMANKELLSKVHGAIGLSFHEDHEFEHYYVYDTAELSDNVVNSLRSQMTNLQVPLHNGIDDLGDPENLCFTINNGYIAHVGGPENNTFIEDWAVRYGYISRFFTFEIPHTHARLENILRTSIQLGLEVLQYSPKTL